MRKNLNRAGFTLIELLAVITIMGILMMVAIPSISRTIENTRRDTFKNTAKSYVEALQNSIASDEIKCGGNFASELGDGTYGYFFDSNATSGKDLMESGGKSSWGGKNVTGWVIFKKKSSNVGDATGTNASKTIRYEYFVAMSDGTHGTKQPIEFEEISRSHINVSGASSFASNSTQLKIGKDATSNTSFTSCSLA